MEPSDRSRSATPLTWIVLAALAVWPAVHTIDLFSDRARADDARGGIVREPVARSAQGVADRQRARTSRREPRAESRQAKPDRGRRPVARERPRNRSKARQEQAPAASTAAAKRPARGRRIPTVRGALRRALRADKISGARYRSYRATWERVRRAHGGDLAALVAVASQLARRDALWPSRMPAVFLQLRRNLEFARSGRSARPGQRVTFGRDPLIFQYVAGHGFQLHPLGNFAEANRLRNACVGYRTPPGAPCHKGALRRLLGRLARMAVRLPGFVTWEYLFPFGGGRAPWISSMAQATAMQSLARAAKLLREQRYARLARAARGAFEERPPRGVSLGHGRYTMYSFAPGLEVLNGVLQTVSGLYDYGELTGDGRGKRLFRAGDRYVRQILPAFDTGSWSLYSRAGDAATREYHRLTRNFLVNLCERTGRHAYCATSERFTRYLKAG